MKILSIGSHFFCDSFRKCGITVLKIIPPSLIPDSDDIVFDFYRNAEKCEEFISDVIKNFGADLIFQGDHSGPLIHAGLEKVHLPKIWYAVDVHLHNAWYKHYAAIFDKVYCAQKNYIDLMSQYCRNVEWLPLYYGGKCNSFIPWNERQHEISFVGTLDKKRNPERVEIFRKLQEMGIDVNLAAGEFDPVYSRSKTVINQSVADDLNLRFFEAPGCGALLITDRLTHSMNDIMIPGVDYLVYEKNNVEDLAAKVKWVHENDHIAMNMARNAQEKILSAHLEIHRAKRILDWFNDTDKVYDKSEESASKAHLSWALNICSKLDIPEFVTDYFHKKAIETALYVNKSEPGYAWSALILAEHAFSEGTYGQVRDFLSQIGELPDDIEYKRQYFILKSSMDYLDGKRDDAIKMIEKIIVELPYDTELRQVLNLFLRKTD